MDLLEILLKENIVKALNVFKKLDKKLNIRLICVGKNNVNSTLLNLFGYEENFEIIFKKDNINFIKI